MSDQELPNKFTIRVYGLLLHRGSVLLSKENIRGKVYVKFPGGGLEFGEGTLACLKREFQEELAIDVQPTEHFYTTENFVRSAFGSDYQVMSIYYKVAYPLAANLPVQPDQDDKALTEHGDQIVYWQSIDTLSTEHLDFPIDQEVALRLSQES